MNRGLEIKRLRKTKKLTQLQLSQKLFVDVSTISKYESGKLEVKTNFILKTLLALDLNPIDYIKELMDCYNISYERLSQITFVQLNCVKDIEIIKDLNFIEDVIDRILIYAESLDSCTSNNYCFNRGDIVSLSDVEDWNDIDDQDKEPSAKFKIITRELDEDKNQYYTVVSLQTNEIFEGYASNFETPSMV